MNLILAIQRGDLKQVKYLLEEESLNIERKDSIGNTPFLVSVDSKKLEIVKYLIEKGANINARTLNGWTALMMAAEDNSFEMVKLLVENGINIDAQENNGANVLFMAISKADSKIIKYLVKNESDLNSVSPKSGFTPFLSYAGKGRIEDLQFLIDSGADINVTEYELFTPLMIYAMEGNLEAVKILVEAGADINAQNIRCANATLLARLRKHHDIEKYLIEHGEKLEIEQKPQKEWEEYIKSRLLAIKLRLAGKSIKGQRASLLRYVEAQDRICPQPIYWNDLYKILSKKDKEKTPPPLILAAWHETNEKEKSSRLEEQIRYADTFLILNEIDNFLRNLKPEEWYNYKG